MQEKEEIIIGVDEVGKGCLFGPVFAAAVALDNVSATALINAGLKDSKKLTKQKISQLSPIIKTTCHYWGLGQASAQEIDNIGIREATERAMLRALQRLPAKPNIIFVDGILPIRCWEGKQENLINGENHSPSIAAASVIAKEARDELIKRLAKKFPQYGLESHVGYGTKFHRDSLKLLGPTKLHRKSFLLKLFSEQT
tara:strand:- start:439 stop:1032 length:594 start_codon:yes stop_codon:yes gene_type:complete